MFVKKRTYNYTLDGLINRGANNIGIISLLAIGWAYIRGGGVGGFNVGFYGSSFSVQ